MKSQALWIVHQWVMTVVQKECSACCCQGRPGSPATSVVVITRGSTGVVISAAAAAAIAPITSIPTPVSAVSTPVTAPTSAAAPAPWSPFSRMFHPLHVPHEHQGADWIKLARFTDLVMHAPALKMPQGCDGRYKHGGVWRYDGSNVRAQQDQLHEAPKTACTGPWATIYC